MKTHLSHAPVQHDKLNKLSISHSEKKRKSFEIYGDKKCQKKV